MMRFVNETMETHIVTLEEPIEFLHRDVRSSITQREIGTDTESFRIGLRAALRQDPDLIVLGELRDAETIDTAMKAAESRAAMVVREVIGEACETSARELRPSGHRCPACLSRSSHSRIAD